MDTWSWTTHLASVIPLLAARAERTRGQDEDLLRDSVHLADALSVTHYGELRLPYSQRYWTRYIIKIHRYLLKNQIKSFHEYRNQKHKTTVAKWSAAFSNVYFAMRDARWSNNKISTYFLNSTMIICNDNFLPIRTDLYWAMKYFRFSIYPVINKKYWCTHVPKR